MIQLPLQIRYGRQPLREPVACLIPGGDPARWLAELTSWQAPHTDLRLHILPRTRQDLRPRGVLVSSIGPLPAAGSLGYPRYGQLAGRLFLPVEACFDPAVSEGELLALLADDRQYVWHPAAGLVGFEPHEVLRVAELLQPARLVPRDWNRAEPGLGFSRRLVALEPEADLSADFVWQQGQEDIGSQAGELDQLPPSPTEPPRGVLGHAAHRGKQWLAGSVQWLTRRAPSRGSQPTWIDQLDQWAGRQLAQIQASLTAARHKELNRLMHLLQTDPDQGLRFALPLVDAGHRGLAPPAERLGAHEVNFNAARLGGGGAADCWDIPPAYHYQLISRYRQLADREIQLGRYRRAAYIFAELLGDWEAAAGALALGRHWREAAVLYRQRLGRPWEAVRCLEQGGLWTEAIRLYQELKGFEKAGDLYARLDQPENARDLYRQAVEQYRAQDDRLGAARVLHEKLQAPGEALQQLAAGWPQASQAEQCLRGLFRLLGQLARHEDSQAWIESLRQTSVPERCQHIVVEVLADTATSYPERRVQQQAADCCRVLIARRLPETTTADGRNLLAALRRLAPEDRLLGRDCERYLTRYQAPPVPRSNRRSVRRNGPTLVHQFQLPKEVDWRAVTWCDDTIYAAGFRSNDVVLVRAHWDGRIHQPQAKPWRVEPRLVDQSLLLTTNPHKDYHVLVHIVGGPLLPTSRIFPATDAFPEEITTGAVPGMSPGAIGATRSCQTMTWLLESRNQLLTLIGLGPLGQAITTRTVAGPDPASLFENVPAVWPVPIYARGQAVYLGLSDRLLVYRRTGTPEILPMPEKIVALQGSGPHTRTRVAVALERGGLLCWGDYDQGHQQPFARQMPSPVANLTRGGHLVAVHQQGGEIYTTSGRQLQLQTELAALPSPPLAVIPSPRANQFGLCLASGEVRLYEIGPT